MSKNWGESFGDAFTQSLDTGMRMNFERWKQEQENDPIILKNKAVAQYNAYRMMLGQPPIDPNNIPTDNNTNQNVDISKIGGIPDYIGAGSVQGNSIPMGGGFGIKSARIGGITLGEQPLDEYTKANLSVAEDMTKKLKEQQVRAGESVSRDAANLNMMMGVFKNAMSTYDSAAKGGLAGNVYKKMLADAITGGKIDEKWAIKAGIKPDTIKSAAAFTSARNEMMTRMQPILSEQFGKEGSMRIMESLLNLAQQEIPDLSAGRNTYAGKVSGTLKNFYRMAKGGIDYASRLGVNAKQVESMKPEDVNRLASQIWNMSTINLSPEEEAQLNSQIDNVLGNKTVNSDDLLKKYLKVK